MAGPLQEGEPCLLIDPKGRRYLVLLNAARELRTHLGNLPHSQVIGIEEGTRLKTSQGTEMLALRPSLADYILKMKRGPQVVYPKDLGPILVYADIAPGSVVVEAGTGSGALTMALVQAVGSSGRVVSVERRQDHAERGRKSIERFFAGIPANLSLEVGAVEEALAEVSPDRIVLDVPEPWRVIGPAEGALVSGGVFCSYIPTVPQMQEIVEALRHSDHFAEIQAFEVLLRTWNVERRSVRPDHHMVGHTGFVTVARKIKPA